MFILVWTFLNSQKKHSEIC